MKKIRILVADDHAILRSGLKMLINAQPDMEVVSEAPDGDPATLAKDITRMTHVPVLFSMESNGARRKSQTHFEQVPIEVVKKIAEQDVSKDKKAGTAAWVLSRRQERKAEPQNIPPTILRKKIDELRPQRG